MMSGGGYNSYMPALASGATVINAPVASPGGLSAVMPDGTVVPAMSSGKKKSARKSSAGSQGSAVSKSSAASKSKSKSGSVAIRSSGISAGAKAASKSVAKSGITRSATAGVGGSAKKTSQKSDGADNSFMMGNTKSASGKSASGKSVSGSFQMTAKSGKSLAKAKSAASLSMGGGVDSVPLEHDLARHGSEHFVPEN